MNESTDTQSAAEPTARPVEPASPAGRNWLERNFPDLFLRMCALLSVCLLILPPEGIPGFEICTFKRLTDVPCPGCGLTRCGSNLLRGNVARATEYNPFGLAIIPAMVGLGILGVLPFRWRRGARQWLAPHSTACQRLLIVFTVAFVLFGFLRGFAVWRGWLEFPTNWF